MRTDFISFQSDDKLEHVVKTFAKERITSAPVFDSGEFIGVVSEIGIVKYFTPKRFLFLWKKDKPTPIEEIKKVTAGMLAKKSKIVLRSNQELLSVLPYIVARPYCLPVIDKGKVVGIVTGDDIVNFFLKEFAKGEYKKELGEVTEEVTEEVGLKMDTEVDKILEIVKRERAVPATKIAKELGLSVKTVEKLGEILTKHHVIRVEYSFFKGAILKFPKL